MSKFSASLKARHGMDQTMGSGDVKYHLGFGSEITTAKR